MSISSTSVLGGFLAFMFGRTEGITESTFKSLGLCCNVFDIINLCYAHMCNGHPRLQCLNYFMVIKFAFFFFLPEDNLVKIVR